jgi:hypothetical protein
LLKQKGMIEFNEESKGAAGSEAVQITNDLYNRIKFMEMAAFFFGYADSEWLLSNMSFDIF